MTWLIDSNILIYASKGHEGILSFLRKHQNEIAVSIVTYYETLNFDMTQEEAAYFKALFAEMKIYSIDKTIVDQALLNRQKKKIKIADNFILATAQVYGLTIVTRNIRDFAAFVQIHDLLS
jgi:predicted nucleic acid-binding protein